MAIGFPAGVTLPYIVANAQTKLAALRTALAQCEDLHKWLAAYSAADLEAAPVSMDTVSANALLSAFADADALYQIWVTGLPPGSYPQPSSAYVYANSARVVIGPLGA